MTAHSGEGDDLAAGLSAEALVKAAAVVACYPVKRSALIPLCHLAQSEAGYLTPAAMQEIAKLVGVSAAEVRGTAGFYDMLHLEPVGRYVIACCTNIACMLAGAYEVLAHAEDTLGVRVGGTTADGLFTLEEAECLAGCDKAVCVQVNHRFFGPIDQDGFTALIGALAEGRLTDTVPPHGVLSRVSRSVGMPAAAGNDGTPSGRPPVDVGMPETRTARPSAARPARTSP